MASASLGLTAAAIGVDVFHSVPMIWISMFLGGLGIGVWDVAMNHEGAEVERGLGRTIMPWFHAAFSGATVASALLGSLLTWLKVPILVHMIVVVVAVLAVSLRGTSWFLPIEDAEEATAHAQGRPAWFEPRTLVIGLVVLAAAFTEGSANDWIAVAMVEGHHLPAWLGVLGFAMFLGFMTIGRLAGTYALDRYGRVPVLRVLFGLPRSSAASGRVRHSGAGVHRRRPVGHRRVAGLPGRHVGGVRRPGPRGGPAQRRVDDRLPRLPRRPALLGYLGDHTGVLHALLAVAAFSVPALLAVPAVREPKAS